MTSIAVISAGLSAPSSTRILAESLAKATQSRLGEPATYDVIELRDLAHALTDNLPTGFPSGALADAVRRVAEADAVIAVTPVYSGLFKTFFDVLDAGTLDGKPVLIAATAGTARHSLVLDFAMRPLFAYLRADVVPTGVFAASSDFGAGSLAAGTNDSSSLSARIDRAAGELADTVLRRGSVLPVDPFSNPTSFEDLLGGSEPCLAGPITSAAGISGRRWAFATPSSVCRGLGDGGTSRAATRQQGW